MLQISDFTRNALWLRTRPFNEVKTDLFGEMGAAFRKRGR
jgi:hypothetical protein